MQIEAECSPPPLCKTDRENVGAHSKSYQGNASKETLPRKSYLEEQGESGRPVAQFKTIVVERSLCEEARLKTAFLADLGGLLRRRLARMIGHDNFGE